MAMNNSLAEVHPELVSEWSDRNYPLLPTQVTVFANRKAWWKCKDCGREWNSLISTRSGGSKCPYCSGYIFLKEKEHYPQWLESQEERRAKIEETKRNREILSNAPPEKEVEKEPEPVVPAWEQKKKVKGFDLHSDVSMAERHTFNLKENEVETVGKKERFRRNIMAIQLLKKCQEEDNSIPADPTVRNFSYTVVDNKIYYRENSRMTPVEVSATAENRIKGMIAIRNSVRTLIELQTEDYPDSEIEAEQERLNRLYDTFSGKYGLINSRANTSAFSQDSSFSLLSALEIIGEDGELERKEHSC
ncbi:zinc-ribbon domain-containing protein [Roseburia sp. BX1005]|uniref:Zinc-ribbon domain-containing protein n=1 Tax=Roseburia zhanii TaxID=2763064 RepID=A0A923LQC4_9FIRM|nr:zinc-ribbon domain-containing protein [Roseburia zhanii]